MIDSSNSNVVHGKYFPHIDGIRTIAVLSVVIYHIFGSWCPGGFVGVDIFFVISGYLITGGILHSLDKGQFSIKDFYTRRIRRIIPAYVVLISFVMLLSGFIYPSGYMENTFKTAAFSSVFSTNVYLFHMAGYFDVYSTTNPLLHLWSLGVEEQFYLLVPLVLMLIYKINRKYVFLSLCVLVAMSLAFSLFCTARHYNDFNFYMLPSRSWELMAGSLFAYWNRVRPVTHESKGGVLGIGGVIISLIICFLYDSSTPFPGMTAIPPVVAALLMLRWGNRGISRPILESPVFVGIGRISYSLYLWHWPICVFWRYFSDDSKNPWGLMMVLGLSFLLGWLSWKFVEMPIRQSTSWSFRKALLWVILGCGVIGGMSTFLVKSDFILNKWKAQTNDLGEAYWRGVSSKTQDFPDSPFFSEVKNFEGIFDLLTVLGKDEKPSYLLWGDSHAMALSPGFNAFSLKSGINGLFLNYRVALIDKVTTDGSPHNDVLIQETLDWIEQHPELRTIVLVNRWGARAEATLNEPPYTRSRYFLNGSLDRRSSQQIFEEGLNEICLQLKKMKRNVVIISSIPEQGFDVLSKCYKNKIMGGGSLPLGVSYEEFLKRQTKVSQVLKSIEAKNIATVIWVDEFFYANRKNCLILNEGGKLLYSDDDHLNPLGGRALLEYYFDDFRKVLQIAESR